MLPARKILLVAACAAACASLSACGGGGEVAPDGNAPPPDASTPGRNQPPPPTRYFSIGGTVGSAFTGKLVLQDQYALNGSTHTDTVTLSSQGAFQVSSQVPQGDSYAVSVATQPPDQYCTVAQGSGTAQASVSNVAVTCAAGTESVLAALGGAGANLNGVPLLASNGDLYVGAASGGANTLGAIVQITPAGKVSDLYSFGSGQPDGSNPYAVLTQGPNGDLYGVTASGGYGGGAGDGTAFELTLGGSEKVLHFFSGGTTDGINPTSPLLLASDGNFYGVTISGGTYGGGTLYRISPTGVYTLLYSFAAATAGGPLASPQGALIQASNGELVGTCLQGGAGDYGGVFTFDPKTDIRTDLAQAGNAFPGPQYGVIQASDGNFYGLASNQGASELFQVTPTGTASVVYSFNSNASGALSSAVGPLVQASDGDLYGVASLGGTSGGGAVFRFDPATGTLTTVDAFSSATGSVDFELSNGLGLGSNGWLYGTFNLPTPGGLFAID